MRVDFPDPFRSGKDKKITHRVIIPRVLYVRRAASIKILSVVSNEGTKPFTLHLVSIEIRLLSGDILQVNCEISDFSMKMQGGFI